MRSGLLELLENSTWFTVVREEQRFLIHVIMTERCNLDCSYCYVDHHGRAGIDYPQVKHALLGVLERVQDRATGIRFFGGEPLLAYDDIKRLSADAQAFWKSQGRARKDLTLGISTNGTLLDEEIKAWFEAHPEISLALSLDGTADAHNRNRCNSYESIKPHFPFFRRYCIPVKMTIGPNSIDHCAAGVKHIHALGFECHANIVFEDVWGDARQKARCLAVFERELAKLVDYYSAHPGIRRSTLIPPLIMDLPQPMGRGSGRIHLCGMGENMTTIDGDGREYPCHRMIPFYRSGRGSEIDEQRRSDHFEPTACMHCELQPMCPECRAHNFEYNGDCNRKTTFHCEFVQLQLRASALLTFRDLVHLRNNRKLEGLSSEEHSLVTRYLRTAQFVEHVTRELYQRITEQPF